MEKGIKRFKNEEDFNFSAWVEDMYIMHKMSEKGLNSQQKHHEKMAKKYKNLIEYSAKKRGKLAEKLTKEQKKQLLSSRGIIKKNAEFFKGQLSLWNNKYPDFKLTALVFKDLLGLGIEK